MKANRIASRYAKSLIAIAKEKSVLPKVYEDMVMFSKACDDSKEFALLLKSPVVKTEKKLAILDSIFGTKMSKESMAFVNLITFKKREMFLEDIISEFFAVYKKENNIVSAIVTTAVKLDASLRKQVEEKVASTYNATVELEERVNEDIIGGFILRVGDDQWDSSILKDLRTLKKTYSLN
ncbi:MAG: ATP synthase F1 subunit delta [Flavobacteriales bacterium]|nr:ATP synthase F1 subunit delta [Flavobacteriales bacterium]